MGADAGLIAWVGEALESIGPVTRRALMGGTTLYCGGTIFAIVADDTLWFKADAGSDPVWDAAGAERFTYARGDAIGTMNYRRAPDAIYDDADALCYWAALALEAGGRAPARKPRRRTGA